MTIKNNPPREGRRVKLGKNEFTSAGSSSSTEEDSTRDSESYQPASPQVKLLTTPFPSIKRPIALIDGQSYAVTTLDVEITETEYKDKNGKVHKHKTPKLIYDRCRVIIRGDGTAFGNIPDKRFTDISSLGINLELPELPLAKIVVNKRCNSISRK